MMLGMLLVLTIGTLAMYEWGPVRVMGTIVFCGYLLALGLIALWLALAATWGILVVKRCLLRD